MPYAQIHTQAPRHPKLLGLSDAAWRLWATGLCYVQEHMTDGVIPAAALATFGVTRAHKAADELVAARLWHQDGCGYRVHDYGDWNHTREEVAKRQTAKRERWARWKERQQTESANAPQTRLQTDCKRTANASLSLPQPQPQPQVQPPLPPTGGEGGRGSVVAMPTRRGVVSLTPDQQHVVERVAMEWPAFVQRVTGARGRFRPALDHEAVCELAASYPEDRIWLMAEVMLRSEALNGKVRNPKLLAELAPELDRHLVERGR